ncbi:hypothetical protein L0Z64_06555 [Phaeobacter sp. BS23]|uniref:hypothetical protein n=1 Tax=Phaeobacter sp. BS23 TaxID=2907239 RepID=UPI00386369C0
MSEPVTQAEIEDVLSSIRRLVSEDSRAAGSSLGKGAEAALAAQIAKPVPAAPGGQGSQRAGTRQWRHKWQQPAGHPSGSDTGAARPRKQADPRRPNASSAHTGHNH